MLLILTSSLFMHICHFYVSYMQYVIIYFSFGIYHQNCMRSIVPASDVKGLWHLRQYSRLCWCHLSLTAKKFGECQICIAVARSRMLSEIWVDIWAQRALRRCISGNLLAITLCKEPRLNRNSFGLSSWLIEHVSTRFKITHLFDVSPKLFLKITSTAKLADKGARMALPPHLVYNCAWPWELWSPTQIETFRSAV